jgi:hypothetical protein
MEIVDVLVGEKSVLFKLGNQGNREYERDDNGKVVTKPSEIPEEILEELEARSIPTQDEFPKKKTLYAHDERAHTEEELAKKFNLNESVEVLEDICCLTYEIPFTVVIEDEETWKVTHAFGQKLEEPYTFYYG